MIDYLAYQQGVVSPLQKAMQGYQLGQQRRVQQEAQALKDQKIAQQQQMKADLTAFASMENKTPKDYEDFILRYPSMSEALNEPLKRMNVERKEAYQKDALNIFMALEGGQNKFASDLIERKKQEFENSGNQADYDTFKALGLILEQSPESAKDTAGLYLSKLMGGEKFAESYAKIKEIQRDEERQAGILAQDAADLGLTKAKTQEIVKKFPGIDIGIKKDLLELESMNQKGIVEPEKKLQAENKLRNDLRTRIKPYIESVSTLQKIKDAAKSGTGAGDIALVTSFMKMLDPGSVVREGEFVTAETSTGKFNQMMNLLNKLQTGQRFKDEKERLQFVNLAESFMQAMEKDAKKARKPFESAVKEYELSPENVFEDFEEKEEGQTEQNKVDSLFERFKDRSTVATPAGFQEPMR